MIRRRDREALDGAAAFVVVMLLLLRPKSTAAMIRQLGDDVSRIVGEVVESTDAAAELDE